MTDQDFQRIVLEKLSSLERIENELQEVRKSVLSVKDDISTLNGKVDKILADQPKDILAMLDVLNDKVSTKEDITRIEDILDVLAARTTRQEAEILGLKRAK